MQTVEKKRSWPVRSIGRLAARLDMRWRYIPHRYTMLRKRVDGAGPSSCSALYIYPPTPVCEDNIYPRVHENNSNSNNSNANPNIDTKFNAI